MREPGRRSIRIATRPSRLALWQAEHVAELLRQAVPGLSVEVVHVSTLGDRDLAAPLRSLGPFGVFTREVQNAVLDDRADLAVHSLKDLPTGSTEGLHLAAVPGRGPAHDALVLPAPGNPAPDVPAAPPEEAWKTLPHGARIGTGSLRRRAQLLHVRSDLEFLEVRGNVETRLRKLDAGEYDALVLAVAGLQRLDLQARITQPLAPPLMFPAVGQGALGLECRAADVELLEILRRIDDPMTHSAVAAERTLLAELRAGCQAPVGAWTRIEGDELTLEGVVLSPDGGTRLYAAATGRLSSSEELGRRVAAQLGEQGADAVIAGARAPL